LFWFDVNSVEGVVVCESVCVCVVVRRRRKLMWGMAVSVVCRHSMCCAAPMQREEGGERRQGSKWERGVE
jgi:hypothetical protein